MMKKTFAFALLLTLCSASNAFGMETFNKAVDKVGTLADWVLNVENAPLANKILNKNDGVLKEHVRYPRAALSCAIAWFTYKSEAVRNFVHQVTAPVKNLVHKK